MIRAATYLGDNTVGALASLVEQLSDVTDHEVVLERGEGGSSRDARQNASSLDLVWMCGALFLDMNDDHALDHDVVAAPVFEGEAGPVYRSVMTARPDGPPSIDAALEQRVAVNEYASWSGYRALRRHLGDRWFREEMLSGSHAASIEAVASGAADCAAIDSSIWNDARNNTSSPAAGLVVIDQTADWPAPPFLLRRSLDAPLRDALIAALLNASDLPGVSSLRPAQASAYDIMRAEEQ